MSKINFLISNPTRNFKHTHTPVSSPKYPKTISMLKFLCRSQFGSVISRMTLPLARDAYELLYPLGEGPTTKIFAAKCKPAGKLVTAKLVNLDLLQVDISTLRQEVTQWSVTSHKNAVKYYGSFVDGSTLWIISELMNGGAVSDILSFSYPRGFKNESIIATILQSVLEFLSYYHSTSKIHRNVRPCHILMNEFGNVAVLGFGSGAALIENGHRKRARYTNVGATDYTAPELLAGQGHDQGVDIWSLGITAFEMATGKSPFDGKSEIEIVQGVLDGAPPVLSEKHGFSPQFREFVGLCLQKDPRKRPTAKALLKHSFIKKYAKDNMYLYQNLLSSLPDLRTRVASSLGGACETWKPEKSEDVELDFGEDQVQKAGSVPQLQTLGRFTISVTSKTDSSAGSDEVTRLRRRVSDLEKRNQEMANYMLEVDSILVQRGISVPLSQPFHT